MNKPKNAKAKYFIEFMVELFSIESMGYINIYTKIIEMKHLFF